MSLPGAMREKTARGGLRRRFVQAITLLIGLVVVGQTAVQAFFTWRHVHEEVEENAEAYATLAVAQVCDAYYKYSETGRGKLRGILLKTAALESDLRAIVIYSAEGRRVFHSNQLELMPGESDLRLFDAAATESLGQQVRRQLREPLEGTPDAWHMEVDGKEHFVVLKKHIDEWGTFLYAAAFVFSYETENEVLRGMLRQTAAAAAVALVLGGLFAYALSAQSLVPLEKLTDGARRLAEGQLNERIALHTDDEFEVLAGALDQMAERLALTIDDLEASNEHLNRLNVELQELDRVKSDLLANVSHELRTPLTAISGYVEAMQEGLLGELEEAQSSSLDVVERNIRRLRGMIDQLLSYSRMDSGQLKVELRAFDLVPVVDHVLEALAAIHGRQRLRREMASRLPDAYGDPGRIGQVIENLMTNALKFSPEDSPVTLAVRELEHGLEIEVRDQGIGIPEAVQEKIFDRFYQVDASTRRRFGGMGLGLAIVREILERNHSTIEVESREGEGAAFRFVLPIATDRSGVFPVVRGPRVVLVDDDAAFVQTMATHLAERGFVVDTAATAEEGEAMVERVKPDIIVLDRMLPDRDGFDLLARFTEGASTRGIPVLVVTVRPEKALGRRLGAAEYLTKPITAEGLEKALRCQLTDRSGRAPSGKQRRGRPSGESET